MSDLWRLWRRSYVVAWRCLVTSRPTTLSGGLLLGLAVPLMLVAQLAHWIGFALDEILFPEYRDVEIDAPLFVVGMPRSGTTFLHATLAADEARFTTTRLWELLLAPSVTERRLWLALGRLDTTVGRPGRRLAAWLERSVERMMNGSHPVALDEPGEDFLFFLPAFASFLLVVMFPLSPAVWELTRVDAWPEEERLRLIRFYRACVQRHVYALGHGDRTVLSKNPSFTACIHTLRDVFPDARFLCCFRDPCQAIPSQLNSIRGGVETFGYDAGDPAIRDRFVGMYEHFVRHSLDELGEEPASRVRFVAFPKLTERTEETIRSIYASFGWTPTEAYAASLAAVESRSERYRRANGYDLEEFGLQERYLQGRFGADMARLEALSTRGEGVHA